MPAVVLASAKWFAAELRQVDVALVVLPACWLVSGYFAWLSVLSSVTAGIVGADAHAYWMTGQHDQLYGPAPGQLDAFLYSPAFATIIAPLTLLPWPAFLGLWALAEATAFAWLLAPLGWRWSVPVLLLCTPEVLVGNVNAFLALAAVLGLRHPSAWAFPLLLKITPALGLVWFTVRKDWRALRRVLLATVIVVSASVALTPAAWLQWVQFIMHNSQAGPGLYLRLAAGVVLAAVAAKVNRAWLLAPAMLLASPVLGGFFPVSILAAVPRLLRTRTDAPTAVPGSRTRLRGAGRRSRDRSSHPSDPEGGRCQGTCPASSGTREAIECSTDEG